MSCASQPLISHFEVHRRRTRERASESAEGAQQPGARAAVIPSQTAAIKFSPHYLRQSHHRPVLGRGGEREERGWRLRVELGGGRHQSLSVCECVFLKDGGGVHWWEKSGMSTFHCGTTFTPPPTRLRPNCPAHFTGTRDLLCIGG